MSLKEAGISQLHDLGSLKKLKISLIPQVKFYVGSGKNTLKIPRVPRRSQSITKVGE